MSDMGKHTLGRYMDQESLREKRVQEAERRKKRERRKDLILLPIQIGLVLYVLLSFLSLPVTAVAVVWGWVDVRWLITSMINAGCALIICLMVAGS